MFFSINHRLTQLFKTAHFLNLKNVYVSFKFEVLKTARNVNSSFTGFVSVDIKTYYVYSFDSWVILMHLYMTLLYKYGI